MPLAHPEQAAIVSSPRIFNDLAAPPEHGEPPEDIAADKQGRRRRERHGRVHRDDRQARRWCWPRSACRAAAGQHRRRPGTARARRPPPTAPRCAPRLPAIDRGHDAGRRRPAGGPPRAPPSATTSPSIRRSAWPAAPAAATGCCSTSAIRRIRRASTRWPTPTSPTGTRPRSTTTAPRSSSPTSGAAAASPSAAPPTSASGARTRSSRWPTGKLQFQSYYKMPAPQTPEENCVAHNGSLIPIPGRDVMVQAWYQGGISVFDWTDAAHPKEIAFFDRGPVDSTRMASGGSWSVYWYNGVIVSSEIARGLDIFELTPSALHLAERDRRGEVGAPRLPQHPGAAEVGLAAELRAGAGVRRSARAVARGSRRAGSPRCGRRWPARRRPRAARGARR